MMTSGRVLIRVGFAYVCISRMIVIVGVRVTSLTDFSEKYIQHLYLQIFLLKLDSNIYLIILILYLKYL
jgi:hypothetical protein